MHLRKTVLTIAVLFAALLGAGRAGAQTQYVYPGESYANTNYGAGQTSQYHYPSTSSTAYPNKQYPAANQSAYENYQAYPASAYQQPAPAPAPQYQPPQYQSMQYQQSAQPQYQTAQAAVPPTPQPYQPTPQAYSGNLGQYPSYQYSKQLDPTYQPPYHAGGSANSSAAAKNWEGHPYMGLETRSGIELGAQLAYYRYSEPSLSVEEKSDDPFIGLDVRGTWSFWKGFYISGEGRYAFTDIDYTGSGEISGRSVDTWEWRGLVGKDFLFDIFSLTPYTGFGYRTLFNDNRGITSDGAAGYRRYNQLYYLPFGIQPRTHIDSDARLTSLLEYDWMFHGLQKSDLADAGFSDPNIRNVQSSGYGLRGEIMYETRTWSIGPYFNYWNIDQSKTKLALDNSAATCGGLGTPCTLIGDEPANHTIEAGVQFRYHFF